jgi:hypothetical protein
MVPSEDFQKELMATLGEKGRLVYDPQNVPVYGPRLYQYWSDGTDYTVSSYLFFATPLTMPLGEYAHKYQIGSFENPQNRVWNQKNFRKE